MTHEELSNKRLWFVILVAYFIFGYITLGHLNMHRIHYFNVSLPFESKIPFLPFFIIGYSSVYLALILIYVLIDDYIIFKRAMLFFIVISTIHFIFFWFLPVKMVRPDMTAAEGLMAVLTKYYYLIDNPTNCFPSLHVAYPLTGAMILWNYKRTWGYLMFFLTVFIAVSVILIKQHYIMDVVGAAVVVLCVFLIGKIFLKRRP